MQPRYLTRSAVRYLPDLRIVRLPLLLCAGALFFSLPTGVVLGSETASQSTFSQALDQNATDVSGRDLRQTLDALRVSALEGNFREEKTIAGFPKPMVSTGRFSLTAQKLVWDVTDPFPSTMTIDSTGIHYASDDQRGFETNAGPQNNEAAKILTGLLSGQAEALEAFFVLKATKTRTGSITIEATPKNEMLSQFVAKAVLTGRTHVETVRIEGKSGETTLILFSDVKATK